jgi:EmrB/QacA subfamily drug resistance transporter
LARGGRSTPHGWQWQELKEQSMSEQPHSPQDLPAPPPRRGLILAAVVMATFMAAVEVTIVATAMPTIVTVLGDFHLFSWVFGVYLLMQAVSVPIYGRLADIYGRKRVFFVGAGLFLLGSTLCGFSNNMIELIVCRALQGLGAGGVQPIAYTIVGDIYSPAERARVQGFVSGTFGVAAIVGPSLGAFLVEHASWSFVFWVNLPIGIIAVAMLAAFLHEAPRSRPRRVDYLGSLLMMLGGGVLMMALLQAERLSRSTLVLYVGIAAVLLAVLIWHERRLAEPMLPLKLWKQQVVAVASLGSFTIGAVMISVSAFLPTYIQAVMGGSAGAAGFALGAMSVSWAAASVVAGRVMIHTSYRTSAVVGGLALMLGSVVLITLTPTSGIAWASTGALLIGIGMGFCNTTYLVSVQGVVSWHDRGTATSANMFMRIVGQTAGAALFGAILNASLLHHAPHAKDMVEQLMDPVLRQRLGGDEIAQMTAAIAASLRNVYVILAVFAAATLTLGTRLPARLSAAPLPSG